MALPLAKRKELPLKDDPVTLADEVVFVQLGVQDLHLVNEDGESVWRFKTVPGAREDGEDSWENPEDIVLGGGAVWTPFTFDPEREELYVAVSNPAPDFPAELRPGDNLYTNSLVALDVRSGELRWYEQLVPADFHDWDLTQVSPLYESTIEGSERNLVATVGKDGLLRVLDRQTHEQWFETEESLPGRTWTHRSHPRVCVHAPVSSGASNGTGPHTCRSAAARSSRW